MLVAMSYNIDSYDNITGLLRRIGIGTLCIEGTGALILATRFVPLFGWSDGIYKSIFHSISAFCNAGFDLFGSYSGQFSSVTAFVNDPVVNVTIMLLISVGGIGFVVWNDIINFILKRKRLSVYSKFVLIVSAILTFGGALVFALLEWSNPATLGSLPTGSKIMAAFFQSVTLRTAGFNSISQADMTQSSQLLSILFMFIGGASGSTAGGVKVVTVGVLIYTVWCAALGKKNTVLFHRTISNDSFIRAVTVVVVQLMIVIVGIVSISALSGNSIMPVAYEVASASGTVGITLGITPTLDIGSKLILMAIMYLGRVGILTVTYAVMVNLRESRSVISYPEANMLIG
jgi:trk system potassium uptake protein TrkH